MGQNTVARPRSMPVSKSQSVIIEPIVEALIGGIAAPRRSKDGSSQLAATIDSGGVQERVLYHVDIAGWAFRCNKHGHL